MCGIAGYMSFQADERLPIDLMQAMVRAMGHRGPNGSGCLIVDGDGPAGGRLIADHEPAEGLGRVVLGHRRLSILDLSERGRQPMASPCGRALLTFNGEVYNYIELRQELEGLGHCFSTGTDTEVVLAAYLQWGRQCFKRFNGMWALALYDTRSGELVLSRDRFGKKPLYYHRDARRIVFASEIKAILLHPAVERRPNLDKIADYAGRHYRYVDVDDQSFFAGINQVPKSCCLVLDARGEARTERYWRLSPDPAALAGAGEPELIEELRRLLDDAVRIRLRSDVPVGTMVSGGMDSTSITALAARRSGSIHAFSGVTGEGYFDESQYIDALVRHAGVRHDYVRPGAAGLVETLAEMLSFHDEPVCTVTWYCNYLITREVASYGIPVILTGHGGDELLAGYWDHYHYLFHDLRASGGDDSAEVAAWRANHGRPMDEYHLSKDYIAAMARDRQLELERFSQYMDCLAPEMRTRGRRVPLEGPAPCELDRRLYLELLYETIPPSLRAEDRNMMAFSIENRVPMLDYRLAELCFNLPARMKMRGGLGKWLLREAMRGVLPEEVRTRKDKVGFNAPFDQWIREEYRGYLEDAVARNNWVNTEVYDRARLRQMLDEHLAGANHYMFFWQYLNLCVWHKVFFG